MRMAFAALLIGLSARSLPSPAAGEPNDAADGHDFCAPAFFAAAG